MTYNKDVDINIPENIEKGNPTSASGFLSFLNTIFVPALIVLVGLGGFGLGRLTKIEESRPPITLNALPQAEVEQTQSAVQPSASPAKSGAYVAARGGVAYYAPWCASAQKIAEKNKVWFATRDEAEKAGYRPAQNCTF